MTELKPPKAPIQNWESVRDEWVRAVESLVTDVEGWCRTNGWPTRRIDKRIRDSKIGDHIVPALLIQADLAKLLLEPVSRFVPGGEGLIDLYLMPEYDDIASLYRYEDGWHIHYLFPGEQAVASPRDATARPFDAATFADVVAEMVRHVGA